MANKQNSEPVDQITRGVINPNVIDLIEARGNDLVVLQMLEDRLWSGEETQLEQLQTKFNNYLDYALDGWLVKQYPAYKDKKIRFELVSAGEPGKKESYLFEEMRSYAKTQGIEFVFTVKGQTFAA